MNNHIQQILYSENKIVKQKPVKISSSQKDIAIVIHVFYTDIWEEIKNYLSNIKTPYDLFITIPPNIEESEIIKIFKSNPDIHIYVTQNRGRDVLPFLQVIDIIGTQNYTYICKMHTKKTAGSDLGNVWRKLLYFDLIGSNKTVNSIIELFEDNNDIGIITGKNMILDSQRYAYGNNDKIDFLAEKTHLLFNDNYLFPAGTMFWIRSSLLEPIVDLFQNNILEFEEEKGQKDDTLAHAIERFFGILCQENNQKIIPSPSDYTKMETQTLDELSALVLSQQYAGLDMFVTQKHAIEEKDQYIQELKALAESLRIKNRLKRLLPKNIKSKVKKILGIFKVIKDNPQVLKKVFYYLSRGELGYLWSKTKEKSRNNLNESTHMVEIAPSNYFKNFDKEHYSLSDITIDIIIPVYNGYEFLKKLFDSVEKNTKSPYRLIVVNDASPDKSVKPYLLKRLEKHPNAIFINHEENQGFLKSVNEAYTHISNHFLLLNTDTEVPEYWMERLMYPIIHMENIASTTPFTNSGEIASFPNFVADNDIFDHMSVDHLDKAFRDIDPKYFYEEVPTGVGFCMGVNYTLTKEIGMFAEDTFGKGYGEENDWCQRAIQKGYKNFIVPNLFVYHKHGGSFSAEEKQELLKVNAVKLLDRHPNYGKDVDKYIQKDPHNTLRHLLVLLAADKKVGTHIIFDHDLGGGANIYANELVKEYIKKRFNTLLIRYDFYTNTFKLYHFYKKYELSFKVSDLEELQTLISRLNLKELFLNSFVSFKDNALMLDYLSNLVEDTQVKLILPIHDYYALCPSYTLLDQEGKYCDIPSLEKCKTCMKSNMQEWRNFYDGDDVNMPKWREQWFKLLSQSNDILCFSNASKKIVLQAYPNLVEESVKVIPHEVEPLKPVFIENDHTKTITIGILGAINYAKGAQVIKHLVQTIDRDKLDLKVVVIGEITESITSKQFISTGRYERNDVPKIIEDHKIDIFLIPSIWPETFSYTTQEIMMMELPLMVFNLGAPAERVANYQKGYVIDEVSSGAVLETIKIFHSQSSI